MITFATRENKVLFPVCSNIIFICYVSVNRFVSAMKKQKGQCRMLNSTVHMCKLESGTCVPLGTSRPRRLSLKAIQSGMFQKFFVDVKYEA